MNSLAEKLASVKARITSAAEKAGRKPDEICLLAVSKTKPTSDVINAIDAGQKDFGENYLQDALPKIDALKTGGTEVNWHFIGAIQSNKTRPVAENFQWVHTLDREKIALRLNEQRPEGLTPLNICIQINLDNETSKSGIDVLAAKALAIKVQQLPNLRLRGLMFIPKPTQSSSERLVSCQRAEKIFRDFKQSFPEADTLSLGMSADLEEAISAGSTMVRIGTDIFGARN